MGLGQKISEINMFKTIEKLYKYCITLERTNSNFHHSILVLIDLFDTMCFEKIKPDGAVFITALSACTHGGLVEEGKRVFNQMVLQFGIKPQIDHYGCMVDRSSWSGREARGSVELYRKYAFETKWCHLGYVAKFLLDSWKGGLVGIDKEKNYGSIRSLQIQDI